MQVIITRLTICEIDNTSTSLASFRKTLRIKYCIMELFSESLTLSTCLPALIPEHTLFSASY